MQRRHYPALRCNMNTMTQPTLHYVSCQGAGAGKSATSHKMAYWEWNATGDPAHPHVIVCAHGLSRQGRDFDTLAAALAPHARVICPDVVGRGKSEWLTDPQGYQIPLYAADMLTMLAQLHQQAPMTTLDWVGTSMGGLIGMALAGQPEAPLPVPVRRLVLNDVGPELQWQALQRIGQYLGAPVRFASEQQAADALWALSTSFGPHTPEQWLALSRPMLHPAPEGGYRLHYDPAIAVPFKALTPEIASQGEALMWQLYDHITSRVLLLRGKQSDLLTPQTARRMMERGPRPQMIEFEGIGHAPTLVAEDQVGAVTRFLLAPEGTGAA